MTKNQEWSGDIDVFADQVLVWREEQGFKTPRAFDTEQLKMEMLGKLMLVVTELSEAAEAVRHGDWANFKEEMADTFIRICDITATTGMSLKLASHEKMIVNAARPHKHGKHC